MVKESRISAWVPCPRSPFFLLSLSFLVLWILFSKTSATSWNDQGRLGGIEALATQNRWDMTDSIYIATGDKLQIDGKYYSNKPLFQTVEGALLFKFGELFGLNFRRHLSLVYSFLTFIFSLLPALCILVIGEAYLKAKGFSVSERTWVEISLVFGTLVLPYSMVFSSHVQVAAFLFVAFVLMQNPMKWPPLPTLAGSGLLLGLSAGIDHQSAFLCFPLGILGLWYSRTQFVKILTFVISVLIPLFATFYLYKVVGGSWYPFILQADKHFFLGNPWHQAPGNWLESERNLVSVLQYLWTGSFGFHGFVSHSPLLLLGLIGLFKASRKKKEFPGAVAILAGVFLSLAFFAFFAPGFTYGGGCYGFRYMVFWMPLVSLYLPHCTDAFINKSWVKAVICLSVLASASGIRNPWMLQSSDVFAADNFDFLRVHHLETNLEKISSNNLLPFRSRIEELESHPSFESSSELAFLYFRNGEHHRALAYLYELGENPSAKGWHCATAVVFSKAGIGLPDLFERHKKECDPLVWQELEKQMKISP